MTKTNSKRTRKGKVGNRGNVSKKYKLTSKQKQIRKHVLKRNVQRKGVQKGGNLEVITFTNKPGIFKISKSTHPYGYIPEGNNEKTRKFSIQSDIWSFGCLIIELFTLTNIASSIHDNDLQKLLKSIIYTDDRLAKKDMDALKTEASRERFEKFVEKFEEKFIRGAAKDNPTFIEVIKLLVTCIFANSVINFENNIFGFDKIIEYLILLQSSNDYNKIIKNLKNELEKLFPGTNSKRKQQLLNNEEFNLGGGGMIQKVFEEIKTNFKNVDKNNIEKIGEGGFGEVYTFPFYTKKLAFKTLKSNRQSATQIDSNNLQHELEFYNECLVTSRLSRMPSDKFPFYYGFAPQNKEDFEFTQGKITNNDPKLFMDYFENSKDLENFLRNQGMVKVNKMHLINYLIQIAEGMKDLHKMGILHLDLAAKNILIMPKNKEAKDAKNFNEYKIKIIDFGKSKLLNVTNLLKENAAEKEVKNIINDSYRNGILDISKKTLLENNIEKLFEGESKSGGYRNNRTKKSKKTKKRVKHNSTKKTHTKKA